MTDFLFILPPAVETPISVVDPAAPNAPNAPIDHVAAGLSRLYMQFRKPGIIAVLTLWLERFNDVETAFQDLLTKRTVFEAIGAQLDNVGKLVGQPRGGLDDDTYRRYLFARIAANNSNGLVEDIIKVASLILNDPLARIVVTQPGILTSIVRIADVAITPALAAILIDVLRHVPLAAHRIVLEYSEELPAGTFTLDDGPGLDDGALAGSLG